MKETPNIITIKDLLYLEDMMNWNFIMAKKICTLLEETCDEECTKVLEKVRKMHTKHYNDLLSIIE